MLSEAVGSRITALRTGPRAIVSVLMIAWFALLFVFRDAIFADYFSLPFPNSIPTAILLLYPHDLPLPWWNAVVMALADAGVCVMLLAYLARGSLPKRLAIMAAAYIVTSIICWLVTGYFFMGQWLRGVGFALSYIAAHMHH